MRIDAEDHGAYRRLIEVGFDQVAAERLSCSRSLEHIERQIAWMGKRYPTRNALGMLRKAIEEDWPEPVNPAVELSADRSPARVFARHFYAGFADNALTPIATPSPADLSAADPLVNALLLVWPDTTQVEDWGREFGVRAAERQGSNQPALSLSLAVRAFGDAFVVWARRDRERHQSRIAASQREAHEARLKDDYRRYVWAAKSGSRNKTRRAIGSFSSTGKKVARVWSGSPAAGPNPLLAGASQGEIRDQIRQTHRGRKPKLTQKAKRTFCTRHEAIVTVQSETSRLTLVSS